LEFDAHLHGEKQLVFLEERLASLLVNMFLVIFFDGLNLVTSDGLVLDILNGAIEEIFVPI
jgi:hypothetical protein